MYKLLLAGLLFISQAHADLSSFQARFELVRNDQGAVVQVKDRSVQAATSLRPYIEFVRQTLKNEQALMAQKSEYEQEMRSLFSEMIAEEGSTQELPVDFETMMNSMQEVAALDVDGIFQHPGFIEVMREFEFKLFEALQSLNPRIIADLENSSFFYTKTATYQAVKFALDFAKRRLSSIPVLNTASYVLVEIEKMIRERRTFHQNMLLHYVEIYSPEELGLTKEEVDHIFSSVYESRIAWFNIWESRAAKEGWSSYGVNKFYADFRLASNRLRNFRNGYSSLGERINFAFQEATVDGERVILNLFQNEAMFKNVPAMAYSFDRPNFVKRKRIALMVSDLGISFLSLPQFMKDIASTYLKSHYEQQRLTEGALFGHFESINDVEMQKRVLSQYLNPFDLNLIY